MEAHKGQRDPIFDPIAQADVPRGFCDRRRDGASYHSSRTPFARRSIHWRNRVEATEVNPFTHRKVALLQTFADQAVIAINNAALFEAEQASKRELQESLEYQTASSEVLGVISQSPSQADPAFGISLQFGNV